MLAIPKTMSEIKAANRATGSKWFDVAVIRKRKARFARLVVPVSDGALFIESLVTLSGQRIYAVRLFAAAHGSIHAVTSCRPVLAPLTLSEAKRVMRYRARSWRGWQIEREDAKLGVF